MNRISTNNTTVLDFSLKGVAEAGFFPSIIIYFSLWYPKRNQTMRIAILFSAATASGVVGSILVCTHRFHKKYNLRLLLF